MDKYQEIMQVSARVFFEKGTERTTMRELAGALSLTTAGLYHYIKDKEDLVQKVEAYAFHKLQEALFTKHSWSKDPQKRIRQFIDNLVGLVLDHPEIYSIVRERAIFRTELTDLSRLRRKEFINYTVDSLIRMKHDGPGDDEVTEEVDVVVGAFSLIGIINWLPLWYDPDGRIKRDQLVDAIAKIFSRWLYRPAERPRHRSSKVPEELLIDPA
ncbi:MAG: TetR/AcrR family transcriptional regulator [Deltaproteobacteria bacterium]|nr:TetR/AcrR family transcriptional regulator [Deltaproteobacteria bacterium]